MNPRHNAASSPAGASAQSSQAPASPTSSQHSLLRASALMASGTLVSRILGLVRSMMLLAVIGSAGGGVAAAFQTANTLPNVVFNILASGVFDAVLVPQIVGAFKRKHEGEAYINRLLTLAGVILFGITVVSMIGAPLLVIITASGYDAEIRALAILFALLCLPQLFFYGLYNLLGELLNARRVFGPYMWAPVVNNVIGIAGLVAFFFLWGTTEDRIEIADFTSTQFWVLGGSATLGVIAQALILLIPMRRAGIRFRPDFHFRGTSFRSASHVAGWTFATLMVSQIGVLSTNNLASLADSYAKTHDVFDVVGINAYATAFMIFMVPQSLISVSLSTAIFTRMAEYAAERDDAALAKSYQMGVQTITFLVLLAAAILMAASVPMMQIVLPTQRHSAVVVAYAIILVALMPGVASTGMRLMSLRLFYAYEDVKPVFLFGIAPAIIQVLVGWSLYSLSEPQWWVAGAAFAETVALIVHALIALYGVAKRNPLVDRRHLLVSYAVFFACAAIASVVSFAVLCIVGLHTVAESTLLRFLAATGKVLLVALVSTPVYLLALRVISPSLSAVTVAPLLDRLHVPDSLRRVLTAPPTGDEDSADIMGTTTDGDPRGAVDEEIGIDVDFATNPDELLYPSFDVSYTPHDDTTEEPESPQASVSSYRETLLTYSRRFLSWCAVAWAALLTAAQKAQARVAALCSALASRVSEAVSRTSSDEGGTEVSAASSDAAKTSVTSRIPAPVADMTPAVLSTPSGFDAVLSPPPSAMEKTPAPRGHVTSMTALSARPAAAAKPIRKGRSRHVIDPTRSALLLAAIITLVAAVWAISTALSPVADVDLVRPRTTEPAGVAQSTQSESGEDAAPAAPVISSVSVLSWNNDEGDHPDMAANMIDQNPETSWMSRYYDVNSFDEDATVTILVTLEQAALVSSVTLQMDPSTQGGQLVVRKVTDPAHLRAGTEIATSALSESTVVSFPEATETSALALSFRTMPTSLEGRAWAWVKELSLQ